MFVRVPDYLNLFFQTWNSKVFFKITLIFIKLAQNFSHYNFRKKVCILEIFKAIRYTEKRIRMSIPNFFFISNDFKWLEMKRN